MVTFVFSNPNHHLGMMAPVAQELTRRGVPARFVSLAELRGFRTPSGDGALAGMRVDRAIPANLRSSPSLGAGGRGDGAPGLRRRLAREVVWRAALGPRLRWLLRGSDAVVVPNDAAFPYAQLAGWLRRRRVPFVLLQEGIRFPLPGERSGHAAAYGLGGASAVCAWGVASAGHFQAIGAPTGSVHVTGNPRYDTVDPRAWRDRGRALLQRLGLVREPLLYLSNPIDDQGFCTTAQKLDLFAAFLHAAAPALDRAGRAVVVKLHPREDVAAYRAAAEATSLAGRVHVVDDSPLFAVLAAGRAAVVLASTVGLEALVFGLPLGVLALPGHGYVFDYVSSGAAVGLSSADLGADVEHLLAAEPGTPRPEVAAFIERHVAHRGEAAARVADRIVSVERREHR